MPRAFGTEMSITRRRAGRLAWAIAIRAVYSARSATSHACCTEAPQAMMPWRARSITCVSAGAVATAAATARASSCEPDGAGGTTGVWCSRSSAVTVMSGIGSPRMPKAIAWGGWGCATARVGGRSARCRRPASHRPPGRGGEPRLGRAAARDRDLCRDADRLEEVPVVGDVLARDVEGGPVPGRGADEWQADEQRHHRAEAEELHGHEPLVVVEGEGQVEGAVARPQEHRVRRERSLRVDAARARRRDRGHDLVTLLVPEGALLARVWVEPRDREPRPGD